MKARRFFLLLFIINVTLVIVGYFWLTDRAKQKQEIEAQIWHENSLKLRSILESNSECHAPCWQGLVPGQSTLEDYRQFAVWANKHAYELALESHHESGVEYKWVNEEEDLTVFLFFEENKLVYIDFVVLRFTEVEMFLDSLSFPSHYSSDWLSDIESVVSLYFYYEDRGIYLQFNGVYPEGNVDETCQLNDLLQPWRLYFVEPNTSYQMRASAFGEESLRETFIRKWEGSDNIIVSGCPY